jgi:multisubunit Na+/H+ antiporter MnhB subunit
MDQFRKFRKAISITCIVIVCTFSLLYANSVAKRDLDVSLYLTERGTSILPQSNTFDKSIATPVVILTVVVIGALVSAACRCHQQTHSADLKGMSEEHYKLSMLD